MNLDSARLPMATLTLTAIIAAAIVLRVGAAAMLGDHVEPQPGIHDQVSYHALANQVVAGRGFTMPDRWWPMTAAGAPTAHWSYLYTLFLSAVYVVFGPHPLAARLIQAAIAGVLYPLLTWRLGRRLFGERPALVAAGLSATYAYFVYYAGALMTETFYILAILWAFDLATGIAQGHGASGRFEPGARMRAVVPWVLLGLALGVAVLLRQLVLLLVPVIFLWLLWAVRRPGPAVSDPSAPSARLSWWAALTRIALSCLVITLLVAPWTARNYAAFGRFVLLNTNAGYAFFWGNHPVHGTSFVSILPSATYGQLIPPELRHLDEAALDRALLDRGVQFVIDDPGRYARLSLSRISEYFQFWPDPGSSPLSNVTRGLSFGLLLPFAAYGLWLGARRPDPGAGATDRRALAGVLYLFVGGYTVIHLLSWTLVRYRLPVDAVLLQFAALALVDLGRRAVRWSRPDLAHLNAAGRRALLVQAPHPAFSQPAEVKGA